MQASQVCAEKHDRFHASWHNLAWPHSPAASDNTQLTRKNGQNAVLKNLSSCLLTFGLVTQAERCLPDWTPAWASLGHTSVAQDAGKTSSRIWHSHVERLLYKMDFWDNSLTSFDHMLYPLWAFEKWQESSLDHLTSFSSDGSKIYDENPRSAWHGGGNTSKVHTICQSLSLHIGEWDPDLSQELEGETSTLHIATQTSLMCSMKARQSLNLQERGEE